MKSVIYVRVNNLCNKIPIEVESKFNWVLSNPAEFEGDNYYNYRGFQCLFWIVLSNRIMDHGMKCSMVCRAYNIDFILPILNFESKFQKKFEDNMDRIKREVQDHVDCIEDDIIRRVDNIYDVITRNSSKECTNG